LIRREPIPAQALHAHYAGEGAYLDCYVTDIDGAVTFEEFIAAFYTTWLFKLERWILAWSVHKTSSDAQARDLARGCRRDFAAWTQEARAGDQLLMCDFLGSTRSWFMLTPCKEGSRLYFGSVVTSRRNPRTGLVELGHGFRLLLGFHKLYSRALLNAARSKLRKQVSRTQ
jgi:hypothetical protein